MSLIKKTKTLWLPLLAMLVSASVTSGFILPNTMMTGQTGQGQSQGVVSPVELELCCLDRFLDIAIPPVSLPALEKLPGDSVPVADGHRDPEPVLVPSQCVAPQSVHECIDLGRVAVGLRMIEA